MAVNIEFIYVRPYFHSSRILTFSTWGCRSRKLATFNPFSWCLCIRTANVLMPRLTRKQSNGEGTAPIEFWRNRKRWCRSSRFVIKQPITTSEWPLMYFVIECIMRSAPKVTGFWNNNTVLTIVVAWKNAPTVYRKRCACLIDMKNRKEASKPLVAKLSINSVTKSLLELTEL